MNLQQTIDELEQKAAEYSQAADSLRALLAHENGNSNSQPKVNGVSGNANSSKSTIKANNGVKAPRAFAKKQTGANKATGTKFSGKRAPVSPETRAKMSASIKAKHQQKKTEA